LSDKSSWEKTRHRIQQRQLEAVAPLLNVKNAKSLRAEVLKLLTQASSEKLLRTRPHELHGLVKLTPKPKEGHNVSAVMVGDPQAKNFKRDPNKPHIARHDGAWFDFSILVDETSKPAQIIGFDFELRFPAGSPASCIRYDLNQPDHANQSKGFRFHVHPGSDDDDFMIHSAPMTPIEILQQFLYGLPIPTKPRATGKSHPDDF
jgi:hypothetical protein